VPGDVIFFSVGDRIPADCRLVEAIDLGEWTGITGNRLPGCVIGGFVAAETFGVHRK